MKKGKEKEKKKRPIPDRNSVENWKKKVAKPQTVKLDDQT